MLLWGTNFYPHLMESPQMSEQSPLPPQPTPAESTPKKKSGCARFALWGGGAFVVLIIIGLLFGDRNRATVAEIEEASSDLDTTGAMAEAPATPPVTEPAAESATESVAEESSTGEGIGISRSVLEVLLGSAFDLEKGTDVEGLENYTATATDGSNTMVQLLGPASELKQASIIVMSDLSDQASVERGGRHMGRFLGAIESDASDWLQKNLKGADYTKTWKDSESFGGVTFTLQYVPLGEVPTFTLTAEPR